MKIAIDCRYIGKSGIGRVCEGLLDNLNFAENDYYLIGKTERLSKYPAAKIVEDDTNPFSKGGLLKFNKKLLNRECSALIIPNFIIPLGVKIKVYTIMHDLIFLDMKDITTNGTLDYMIKKYLLKRCMKKSESISCVSEFTLKRCEFHFKKYAKKCYLNYVGLSKELLEYANTHKSVQKKSDTFVFVGNVKPNKGLKTLLDAFANLDGYKLKIIGERDNFLTGLSLDEKAYKNVEFTGRISDDELFEEISRAKYLIQPSLYEGFGAPPLEALYLGTQPIISDIEVFREVYADLPVIYFSDKDDLAIKMQSPAEEIECKTQIFEMYNYKNLSEKIVRELKKDYE